MIKIIVKAIAIITSYVADILLYVVPGGIALFIAYWFRLNELSKSRDVVLIFLAAAFVNFLLVKYLKPYRKIVSGIYSAIASYMVLFTIGLVFPWLLGVSYQNETAVTVMLIVPAVVAIFLTPRSYYFCMWRHYHEHDMRRDVKRHRKQLLKELKKRSEQ